MWPDEVEGVAALLRDAGIEGTLEELPKGVDVSPGTFLHGSGFVCDGRPLVALIPSQRELDRDKLAAATRCAGLRSVEAGSFPYRGSRVVLDRSALTEVQVWLTVGARRHVLGLPPAQLVRFLHAETADLVADG